MTTIVCKCEDCVHNDGGKCTAETILVAYNNICLTWEVDEE